MPLEILIVFFMTSCLLAITPGPDNLFVLSQSLAYGQKAGILVTLGLCSGLIFHTSLVAGGVAAVLASSAELLFTIKLLGVAYLLFLARQNWSLHISKTDKVVAKVLSSWQLYRRGIIMNITNPKVGLFFIAFLPQFTRDSYGVISTQVMILGLLFIVSTLLVFGGIAMLAGTYSKNITASTNRQIVMNRFVSIVFVLLAINLLLFNQ